MVMAGRRDSDWQAEWEEDQLPPGPPRYTILPPSDDHEVLAPPCLRAGHSIYVVQSRVWWERDEYSGWSPETGQAILAFSDLERAREYVQHEQMRRPDRLLGIVEVYLDDPED
jgi:hypothetical protein